ncbi:MAG TPA: hypothetical protein VF503_28740 [Sphingobium sp.]
MGTSEYLYLLHVPQLRGSRLKKGRRHGDVIEIDGRSRCLAADRHPEIGDSPYAEAARTESWCHIGRTVIKFLEFPIAAILNLRAAVNRDAGGGSLKRNLALLASHDDVGIALPGNRRRRQKRHQIQ